MAKGMRKRAEELPKEKDRDTYALTGQKLGHEQALAAILSERDEVRATGTLAMSAESSPVSVPYTLTRLLELGVSHGPDVAVLFDVLDALLKKHPELPIQVGGANLRGLLCDGVTLHMKCRLYSAPGLVALNELVGFRILPNVWEHIRATTSVTKQGPLTALGNLLDTGGLARAPLYDHRPHKNTRVGSDCWG